MAVRLNRGKTNIKKFKDKNKFAYFEAQAGRCGILKYRENGKIVKELLHPDDVFDPESMASLAMKPFTLQHEGGMVKPETATGRIRGTTGENITRDGDYLICKVGVFDETALKDIEEGIAVELSAGYSCDVDPTSGIWRGEHYDRRQTNIRYNHLTGATCARASGSKLRLNCEDPDALISLDEEDTMSKFLIPKVKVGELRLNSIEIEDTSENKILAEQREEAVGMYEAAMKSVSEGQAKFDRLNADFDQLKQDSEKMVPVDRLNSIVAKHTLVAKMADASGVEMPKEGNIEDNDNKIIIDLLSKDGSYDADRLNSDEAYRDVAWDLFATKDRIAKLQSDRNLAGANDPNHSNGSIDYTTKPIN